MKLKKSFMALLTICLLVGLLATYALACPAYDGVRVYTDPFGKTTHIITHGDEFFSYATDTSNNLVAKDATGVMRYVTVDKDGGYIFGSPANDGTLSLLSLLPDSGRIATAPDKASYQSFLAATAKESRVSQLGSFSNGGYTEIPAGTVYNGTPLEGKIIVNDNYPQTPERGDSVPLLVLLVEYGDPYDPVQSPIATKCLFTDEEWNERIFSVPEHSVSGYYDEVSNGQFTYTPAVETSGTANDGVIRVNLPIDRPLYTYGGVGQNSSSGACTGLYSGYDGNQYAIYNESSIFAYVLNAANGSIDFSSYDKNGDGFVSPTELAFLMVQSGYEGSFYGPNEGDAASWAHSWTINDYLPEDTEERNLGVELDGVQMYKYTQEGENYNYDYKYDGSTPDQQPVQAEIGAACHELGHDLGLMDLYDTQYGDLDYNVGPVSLMASGSWGCEDEETHVPASSPVHLDALSKIQLGFYDYTEVTESGTYTLAPAGDVKNYSVLKISTKDPNVYYLVENRTLLGYDKGIRGRVQRNQTYENIGGLVYWRIDKTITAENWNVNTINTHEGHYGIMPAFVEFTDSNLATQMSPFRNTETSLVQPMCTVQLDPGITLTAESTGEGSARVTVSIADSSEAEVNSYAVRADGEDYYAFVLQEEKKLCVTVPEDADLTALTAKANLSVGAKATVNGKALVNGETVIDYSKPAELIVTSSDGSVSESWTLIVSPVSVNVASSGAGRGVVYPKLQTAVEKGGEQLVSFTSGYGCIVTDVLMDGESIMDDVVQTGPRTWEYVFTNAEVELQSFNEVFSPLPATHSFNFVTDVEEDYVDYELEYTDITTSDWFYEGVFYVEYNGLMSGSSKTEFSPNTGMTREMVWAVLGRLSGEKITGVQWNVRARDWAMANGISDGSGAGQYVTRQEFAAMLYRYASCTGADVTVPEETGILNYDDFMNISQWAFESVNWAYYNGLINGNGNALAPLSNVTRGEAATILLRFGDMTADWQEA